jgi:hypothetical protein
MAIPKRDEDNNRRRINHNNANPAYKDFDCIHSQFPFLDASSGEILPCLLDAHLATAEVPFCKLKAISPHSVSQASEPQDLQRRMR